MHIRLIQAEARLCRAGMAVSALLLASLVLLSGLNVVFRMAGHPISATYELSGLAGALLAALALAETQRRRGHVELDLFTRGYSPAVQRRLGAVNVLAGALLMIVLALQMARRAGTLLRAGEVSETLKLPYPWLMYAATLGLLLLAVSFLTDFVLLVLGHGSLDAEAKAALRRTRPVNSIRSDVEEG
jgi:TRAP-type C4-dicarboxylate transport system permease small subunit